MNRKFPVSIDGQPYSPAFQANIHDWKPVLAKAYSVIHAMCLCPGKGERKLAIKRIDESDGYHLARFPGTGPEHANECRFYAPAPERSGMQGYEREVVEEGEDGMLRIRLARGFRIQQPAAGEEPAAEPVNQRPGQRKRAMTLLGLLHLLWQESRLNFWYPAMEGKRNAGVVTDALYRTAGRIGTSRIKLNDVLLTSALKESPKAQRNTDLAAAALTKNLRVVVVGTLASYDKDKHSDTLERLPMYSPFGIPSLFLERGLWARSHRSFRQEISAWMKGHRTVAIAQVELKPGSKNTWGKVIDLALMSVSEQWIPVDSGYEAVIEARLREQKRAFEKPMRFDSTEEEIFPDFWLLDVGRDFPMEVFGMATPEYLARKQVKRDYYNREYGNAGWWSWNADRDPSASNIPTFPASTRK